MERKKDKKGDNREQDIKVVVKILPVEEEPKVTTRNNKQQKENEMKKQTDEFTKDELDEACDMLDASEFTMLEDLAIAQERLEKWRTRFTTSLKRLGKCRAEVSQAAENLGQFYDFLNRGKYHTSTEQHSEDKNRLLN